MKREFYIYQEELVNFRIDCNAITLSEYVKILNDNFCEADMKKLRTESIVSYLITHNFLNETDKKLIPTLKGKLLGIAQEERTLPSGDKYIVNVYSNSMLKHITDNIYSIIL